MNTEWLSLHCAPVCDVRTNAVDEYKNERKKQVLI